MADMTLNSNTKPKNADHNVGFFQRRDRIFSRIMMYAILIFFSIVSITPFFWMISTSLMTTPEALAGKTVPREIQWDNYQEAWEIANFSEYFVNSAIIAIVSIIGALVICVLAAYAFARIDFPGRDLMFTLLLATLMIPESVVMIPNFLTVSGEIVPLVNTVDYQLVENAQGDVIFQTDISENAIRATESNTRFSFTFFGIGGNWLNSLQGLTVPFLASAFSIFLLRQFFAQIPDELWEAAKLDGAGHTRFLIQIAIPIARPAIVTVVLLTFIGAWNAFLWPLIITTTDNWRPIVLGLYNFQQEGGTQLNLQMAAAFITIIPMLVLYFLTQKTFTEGLATTGLKG